KPEILDTLPYDQARASLSDLTRLNARWGGHSTLRKLLADAVVTPQFTLLDVGAASADMGRCIRGWYSEARVTALDYIASHLTASGFAKLAADAFRLPFRPKTFDFVFCSLFLHHFTDDQIVHLLREFGAIARRAVLVIDLERHPIPYYFVPWTYWFLGWHPVTQNDAPISVEAAFKPRELEQLAERAGLTDAWARTYRPACRIALLAN